MSPKLSQIGEFGLIKHIEREIGSLKSVIKGIGDDTAVIPYTAGKGKRLLLTTDMLTEGVHFTRKMPAKSIGHKAMAGNISDIAAMGGMPKYALVSLGVSPGISLRYIQEIYQGMKIVAREYGCQIVGGDTIKNEKLIINIFLVGEVKTRDVVLRSGAKKGDQIFVTGPLGNSYRSKHHLTFQPRIKESQYLVKHYKPSAMIDCSDGLAADLGHILNASGVGAFIYEDQIPRRGKASLNAALHDGEDFELIFTLSAKEAKKMSQKKRFRFFHIGEITEKKRKFQLVNRKGKSKPLLKRGFVHF